MKKIQIILLVLLVLASCSKSVSAPTNLLNNSFPRVHGKSLAGDQVTIPDDYKGKVVVVLVGFLQRAQFDIDRWILGLLQAEVPARIVELPTIAGMMPQMVQGFIDNGMRSGIPKNDWASVVTIYEDANKIIEAIGNERPQNAHVLLLGPSGNILWSSDSGYSAQQILDLKKLVLGLP